MNRTIRSLACAASLVSALGLTSCEEYLTKAPEAELSTQEVFGTFRSFQGFVEELYHTIPDYTRSVWNADWHVADEVLATDEWRLNVHFDNGNYWAWYTDSWGWDQSFFFSHVHSTTEWTRIGLWNLAWYGIRKANVGLANLHYLTDATPEEKALIEGQLLFFRGFLHFQLMSFWGGLPYIDRVLGNERLDLPRLNYRQTALRAAEDLERAATLLPANWDNTQAGRATLGHNFQRVSSATAYAYLGKNLLYAASPLMNLESTGSPTYDTELAQRAAAALYNALYLSHTGQAPFRLADSSEYMDNFYTLDGSIPGYPEQLMGPRFFWNNTGYDATNIWLPEILGALDIVSPTHNYVENFGMANGLPLDHPASGFDPTNPWYGRDPRFYLKIIHDGMRVVQGGTPAHDDRRYANLYIGGNYRHEASASRTGYLYRKFSPVTQNNIDAQTNVLRLPGWMRLADVYLMYAEAVLHGYGTPQSAHSGHSHYVLTAVDAVNRVRARFGIPGVHSDFLVNTADLTQGFMGEIIRERAVELMGEANIRFCDLRRWLLNDDMEFRQKTAIDFDRDPVTGRPINMVERVVVTRVVEDRHSWLPLPTDQVTNYVEFGQNPGW